MKKEFVTKFFTLAVFLCAGATNALAAERIPMIDAHSQIDHLVRLEAVIPLMDRANIKRVILSTRGKRELQDIVRLARENPGRVTASLRLKGKDYEKNSPRYREELEKNLQNPAFGAMAEALVWHAQKGSKAGEVSLDLSSPQVMAAFNAARKKSWPFVVHIEFASAGKRYATYMKSLESFLQTYPDHPIAMIHMGQLTHGEVSRLIGQHKNIFFLTSHANPIAVDKSGQPWIDLFAGSKFKPEWKQIMISNPDRFILAFDNVWAEHWGDFYLQQSQLWQTALAELPPEVAHAIAHRNAERLWKLPAIGN